MIRTITATLILSLTLSGFALAGSAEKIKRYHILPSAVENEMQGCKSYSYSHDMRAALRFLIFPDANIGNNQHDIHYALRHTHDLFRPLYQKDNTAENFGLFECFPSSWLGVGITLALMNPSIDPAEDAAYIDRLKTLRDNTSTDPAAFPVMSRTDYITLTGCKTSPLTYNKYRIAYERIIIRQFSANKALENMRGFLEDLYSAQPDEDGFVNQKCLVPAISRIASEYQLLDAQGRYKSTKQ
jgi:hypothetical protein